MGPLTPIRVLKRAVRDPVGTSMTAANHLFAWGGAGADRPAFYEAAQVRPELKILDDNFATIKRELEGVLAEKQGLPRYHEVDPRQQYISGTIDPEKDWRIFVLKSPAGEIEANRLRCPETTALLDRIPGLLGAMFSVLDPGKSIPAHNGPYLGYLRYHLGLKVPAQNPPSIRVRDTTVTWEEGKSIVFDDSWEHEVYNQSDGVRVVLIVDFFRPMSKPLHAVNLAVTHMLARYTDEGKKARRKLEHA